MVEDIKKEVEKIISLLQKEYNLTDEDIASKLHVSLAAVRTWKQKTRKPSHFVLEKFQQILRGYELANSRKA